MSNKDIVIKIHIEENSIEPKDLTKVFDFIEESLYESDRRDVIAISNEIGLPNIIMDAALERLRRYRNRRINLQAVHPGSIEVDAILLAVVYKVLDLTIGEAIKNGIQQTVAFKKLSEIVRARTDQKFNTLFELIQSTILSHKLNGNISIYSRLDGEAPKTLVINLRLPKSRERERIPTLGEL